MTQRSIYEHEALKRARNAQRAAWIITMVVCAVIVWAAESCRPTHRPQYAAVTE
jgi:hypothetical protein